MTDTFDLAALCEASGTKFLLALFVDLNGKPCAKLVPVEAAEELGRGPRLRRVRRRRDRAEAAGSRPHRRPGPGFLHARPVRQGRPGDRPLRPPRGRQAVALRPSRDPQGAHRTGRRRRLRGQGRRRGGVLPASSATPTGALVPADSDDVAARPCYDARGVTRMYDHLTSISTAMNAARLGQLRQRPRRRQRPVRAELPATPMPSPRPIASSPSATC